jgi:hypothetical protein
MTQWRRNACTRILPRNKKGTRNPSMESVVKDALCDAAGSVLGYGGRQAGTMKLSLSLYHALVHSDYLGQTAMVPAYNNDGGEAKVG